MDPTKLSRCPRYGRLWDHYKGDTAYCRCGYNVVAQCLVAAELGDPVAASHLASLKNSEQDLPTTK